MSALDPWTGLGSRLPDDDAYWDGLAHRVRQDAAPVLASWRSTQSPWLALPARYARPLAFLAAAAVLATLAMFRSVGPASAAPDVGALASTIEPVHPSMAGMLDGHGPPRLEAILFRQGAVEP